MTSVSHASPQELLAGTSPPPIEAAVASEIWMEALIDMDMEIYIYMHKYIYIYIIYIIYYMYIQIPYHHIIGKGLLPRWLYHPCVSICSAPMRHIFV